MRVMVVGGAGYIGSALVPMLLQKGHEVRVVDRFFYGDDGVKPFAGQVELINADMRQVPGPALQGVDAVINLGGLSNDPTANYNPDANWQLNFHAVVRLATRCKARDIRRYIFAGSCSVYDRRDRTEAEDLLLTEEASLQPVGYYSEAKHAAEQALLYMLDDGFSPVILRKGTVYGYSKRMRFDLVVNAMVRDALATGALNLFGGGENWRPLVSVNDAARAYMAALEAPDELVRGEVFNIVHSNLRISELGMRVQSVLRSMGVPCEIRSDYSKPAARNYRVSGEKARRVLGYTAETSVEDAVREMIQQFRGFTAKQLYNPVNTNIEWMQMLERAGAILGHPDLVFAETQELPVG